VYTTVDLEGIRDKMLKAGKAQYNIGKENAQDANFSRLMKDWATLYSADGGINPEAMKLKMQEAATVDLTPEHRERLVKLFDSAMGKAAQGEKGASQKAAAVLTAGLLKESAEEFITMMQQGKFSASGNMMGEVYNAFEKWAFETAKEKELFPADGKIEDFRGTYGNDVNIFKFYETWKNMDSTPPAFKDAIGMVEEQVKIIRGTPAEFKKLTTEEQQAKAHEATDLTQFLLAKLSTANAVYYEKHPDALISDVYNYIGEKAVARALPKWASESGMASALQELNAPEAEDWVYLVNGEVRFNPARKQELKDFEDDVRRKVSEYSGVAPQDLETVWARSEKDMPRPGTPDYEKKLAEWKGGKDVKPVPQMRVSAGEKAGTVYQLEATPDGKKYRIVGEKVQRGADGSVGVARSEAGTIGQVRKERKQESRDFEQHVLDTLQKYRMDPTKLPEGFTPKMIAEGPSSGSKHVTLRGLVQEYREKKGDDWWREWLEKVGED
jgi:hypothetical protein